MVKTDQWIEPLTKVQPISFPYHITCCPDFHFDPLLTLIGCVND